MKNKIIISVVAFFVISTLVIKQIDFNLMYTTFGYNKIERNKHENDAQITEISAPKKFEIEKQQEISKKEQVEQNLDISQETAENLENIEKTEQKVVISSEDLAKQAIENYKTEIYALEGYYVAVLNKIVDLVLEEFYSYPPDEQTNENLQALASSKIAEITKLEDECDSKLRSILLLIDKELAILGQDERLTYEIKLEYENKKEDFKTQIMAKIS